MGTNCSEFPHLYPATERDRWCFLPEASTAEPADDKGEIDRITVKFHPRIQQLSSVWPPGICLINLGFCSTGLTLEFPRVRRVPLNTINQETIPALSTWPLRTWSWQHLVHHEPQLLPLPRCCFWLPLLSPLPPSLPLNPCQGQRAILKHLISQSDC